MFGVIHLQIFLVRATDDSWIFIKTGIVFLIYLRTFYGFQRGLLSVSGHVSLFFFYLNLASSASDPSFLLRVKRA